MLIFAVDNLVNKWNNNELSHHMIVDKVVEYFRIHEYYDKHGE